MLKSYFSNLCNNFEVKLPCWTFNFCFRWWLEWWSLPLPSRLGFTSNSNKCSQYLKNIPQLLQKIAYAVVNFFLTLKAVQGPRCPEKRKREHFHVQSLPVQPVCSICQAIGIFFRNKFYSPLEILNRPWVRIVVIFIKFVTIIKFQCVAYQQVDQSQYDSASNSSSTKEISSKKHPMNIVQPACEARGPEGPARWER